MTGRHKIPLGFLIFLVHTIKYTNNNNAYQLFSLKHFVALTAELVIKLLLTRYNKLLLS